MHDVFSAAWVQAWATELASSEAYQKAAAAWEGSIALQLTDPAPGAPAAVFLDLWHGECRQARPASGSDLETADYLLSGSTEVWRQVLAGQVEPIFGLMTGKLKLARGSLASLTPYMAASKELVAAATRVPSRWP